MRNQFFAHTLIHRQLRNAMATGFLLALCATLQGCATSMPNPASYSDSQSQAFINMELNRGAEPQESPCIRLVSFRF